MLLTPYTPLTPLSFIQVLDPPLEKAKLTKKEGVTGKLISLQLVISKKNTPLEQKPTRHSQIRGISFKETLKSC